MTPILNSTLPYSVSTLRHPTHQELKQCGADYCVALCLHQAIDLDPNLAVKDDGVLFRFDGTVWSAVPEDMWPDLIREAAIAIVGTSPIIEHVVKHRTLHLQRRQLHRFPSGDLLCDRATGRVQAYRAQGYARDDGLDIDWGDVVVATGRYVPMVSNVEQLDHPVLAHLHSASRLALHATIHAGAERFQIEQERAALRQALADAAGEVETSAADRRRARL